MREGEEGEGVARGGWGWGLGRLGRRGMGCGVGGDGWGFVGILTAGRWGGVLGGVGMKGKWAFGDETPLGPSALFRSINWLCFRNGTLGFPARPPPRRVAALLASPLNLQRSPTCRPFRLLLQR